MAIDSKTVNKEIRARIRPALEEAGFSAFTGRNSWRYAPDRIDVVNFQSFNSYNARVIGCTTYSFSVNLASYLPWIPRSGPREIKEVRGRLRPDEWECPLRGRLFRGFAQPELDRREIWYIDPQAKYLDQAIEDVRDCLLAQGLSWFDQFSDVHAILRIFRHEDMSDGLWGFGRNPSPMRSYLIGYSALQAGDRALAQKELRRALESGCFKSAAPLLEQALSDASTSQSNQA